ncbi:hypothetical protein DSO57_1037248 [Entomophthora muscae]|uniref:Uncharacterized protein n=1 Tax=Entomophthora muscae TaxID=34485 RepID=A0ACC2T9Y5_9FUNG|nr:hypothetical protein DSO57_1037248 [Entomophthora muscae]
MGFCLYRTHTPVNLYPKAERYRRKMTCITLMDSIKEEDEENITELTQSAASQNWIAPAPSQNHDLVKQYDLKRIIFQFYSWAGLFIPQNGQDEESGI